MARVQVEEVDGVTVATLLDTKILDDPVITQIGTELLQCVQSTSNGRMLLDFSNVRFMSSSMLGRLVMLSTKCKNAGVDLKLCCLSDDLAKVFTITNLRKVFDIQKDREKAMKAFEGKRGWFR